MDAPLAMRAGRLWLPGCLLQPHDSQLHRTKQVHQATPWQRWHLQLKPVGDVALHHKAVLRHEALVGVPARAKAPAQQVTTAFSTSTCGLECCGDISPPDLVPGTTCTSTRPWTASSGHARTLGPRSS